MTKYNSRDTKSNSAVVGVNLKGFAGIQELVFHCISLRNVVLKLIIFGNAGVDFRKQEAIGYPSSNRNAMSHAN